MAFDLLGLAFSLVGAAAVAYVARRMPECSGRLAAVDPVVSSLALVFRRSRTA